MKAAVTGLPMVMAESSQVVSTAVSNQSSSDSSELDTNVSWSAGLISSSSSGIVAKLSWSFPSHLWQFL